MRMYDLVRARHPRLADHLSLDRKHREAPDPGCTVQVFDITHIARYYDEHYRRFKHGDQNWNEIASNVRPPFEESWWEFQRLPGMFPEWSPRVSGIAIMTSIVTGLHTDWQYYPKGANRTQQDYT
ncbi:MAG: hypothetical protein ACR2J8_13680, partial [Thermomicrobiales bacterium]